MGSVANSSVTISWSEDMPHDTLISLLGLLANSKNDHREGGVSADLHGILTKYGEHGKIQHAVTQYLNGHKLELAFQVLQRCVKLASNNLLLDGVADNFLTWITTSGLSANFEQLLNLKIPTVDTFKSQMLISASRLGLSDLVSSLIATGADVNARSGVWTGDTPLEAAVLKDRHDIVQKFLDAGADPCPTEAALYPPLYGALAQSQGVQIVELLIKHGANVKTQPRGEKPILGEAIKHRKSDLVEALLKSGADVNAASYYRGPCLIKCSSALQCAVWMNDVNAVRLLLKNGADVNASNSYSRSMHLSGNNEPYDNQGAPSDAEVYGDEELRSDEKMSMHEDSEDDEYLKTYLTPIQIACMCDRPNLVQLLVEAGADVNVCPWEDLIDDICRKEDRHPVLTTALQAAVANSRKDLAQYLLLNGANVDAKGCPFTALQLAAGGSDLDMVELLLEYGADVNAPGHGNGGRTALQAAAKTGHSHLIRLLLRAGAEVNTPACAYNGRTAFQAAAAAGHTETANILLSYAADFNAPAGRKKGQTCLQAAARGLHSDMVNFLLHIGADPNGCPAESSGLTALQMSFVAIIETIAPEALDEGTINDRPWSLPDVLDQSPYEEHKWDEFCTIVTSLIDHGADINARPSSDSIISTAGLAVASGQCFYYLLGKGLDWTSYPGSSSAILEAIASRDTGLLSALTSCNVDLNVPGISLNRSRKHPLTALVAAAACDDLEMTKLLLEAGANLESPDETRLAYTPLGLAVENLSVSLVGLLLEKGADPSELYWSDRYEHMMAPLFYVICRYPCDIQTCNGVSEIVTALLNAEADPNFRCLKFDRTPLQAAVANNHREIAQKLIDAGADVDAPAGHYFGRTALQLAAERGNMEMFQLLRSYNADVNAPPAAWRGVTALQAAAISGCFEMVSTLLQDGAHVAAPASDKGRHALEGAAEHGRLDIVVLLLEHDDEPSTFHKRCAEAAERAVHNGRNTIARLLKDREAATSDKTT